MDTGKIDKGTRAQKRRWQNEETNLLMCEYSLQNKREKEGRGPAPLLALLFPLPVRVHYYFSLLFPTT